MKFLITCLLSCLLLAITGCAMQSTFDFGDNWLIRENDIPQYFSQFDLFYIGTAPTGYGSSYDVQFNWAKTHTNDVFGKGVRVFAPKILKPDTDTVSEALEYYLDNFHTPGHPFVLLAEGDCADILYKAMQKCNDLTVENGFVAAYLPDISPKTSQQIADDFYWQDLKTAQNADDFGVIITWNACINNSKANIQYLQTGLYNINPINWKTDGTPGRAAQNIKSIFYMPVYKNQFLRKIELTNFCGAVIDQKRGLLVVKCPRPMLHKINDELVDNSIAIFAGNIAKNAADRTRNLIKSRQWQGEK